MKTKTYSINELYAELCDSFGEWIEMGHPVEDIALALLFKEREKNADLQMKIDRLERMVNS
jgi:hypothetical protein